MCQWRCLVAPPHLTFPCYASPAVKRVVITLSTATVVNIPELHDPPRSSTFTEKDWNLGSERVVNEWGREAPQMEKYQASKSLAEQGKCCSVCPTCIIHSCCFSGLGICGRAQE